MRRSASPGVRLPPPRGAVTQPEGTFSEASVQQTVVSEPEKTFFTKKNTLIIAVAAVAVVVLIAALVQIPAPNEHSSNTAITWSDGHFSDDVEAGDMIEFGSYEQDGDSSDGKEPIKWRVLSVDGGRAFVVSDKGLDARVFNDENDEGNDWSSSDLKAWLEDDFVSQAFSNKERKSVDGAPTLLSKDEVNKYFKSDKERLCYPTRQVKKDFGWSADNDSAWHWWLRTPGNFSFEEDLVNDKGAVSSDYVSYWNILIRPAIWIEL